MEFTFENKGTHTYLVYEVSENDVVDSMSLGMITNNKILGLAPTMCTQLDATRFIKYDVSAKISVKQFFSGQVNKKRLVGVFRGIVDAMMSAEDYMIDLNSILLDLNYIYADVSTCETVMICLPMVNDDLNSVDLGVFFKNIMFSTQFDQTENCDHVAKIINYLNSTPVFSLEEFKKVLEAIDGAAPAPAVAQSVATAPQVVAPTVQPVSPPVPPRAPQDVPQTQGVKQPVAPKAPQKPAPAKGAPAQQRPQPAPAPARPVPPSAARGGQPQEKQMSFWYLMQHYNSENKALYKAQKEAKKAGAAAPKQPQAAPNQGKRPPQPGFAVPGQPTPQPGNQGFAIPGQPAPQPGRPVQNPAPARPVPQQTPMNRPAPAPAPTPRPAPQPQQPVAPVYNPVPQPQGQPMNFGETTVLGVSGIGETTVLGATPATMPKPCLVRLKTGEKINLNKPVFRIGKEKSYVDYFIGDNSAISRSHANLITRDGEYFVMDTNSTNHTYVDGTMIQSNVETKISHGTKIRLANEDFEFKLL